MRVYHYRRDLDDKNYICSLGCKHWVTYHEMKIITVVDLWEEYIEHLHYTHGGNGPCQRAKDAQGRSYIRKMTYSGYGPWEREDGKDYWVRPVLSMDKALTLDGRPIV